ncbi:MAG: DUF2115 family protein [Methanobacteriaceae archaeon]|nr:DUF2115 family protein [Methanobacteriaceae archaeon]
MKASILLNEIKENISNYDINILKESLKKEDINPIAKQVSTYNLNNYEEIIDKEILDEEDFEISDNMIESMKNEIKLFFEGCSPESEDSFKKFIESICLYLSLIAKKPLHPVGMDFGENNTVEIIKENGKTVYYCDIKKPLKEKAEEYYTCKYCICKIR